MPSNPRKRARQWCFTINNWTDKILSHCLTYFEDHNYIIGEEVGDCGTKHLQGYVKFNSQKEFKVLKEQFPTAHFEIAKGSLKDNVKYCSKDGIIHTNIDLRPASEKLISDVLESEYKDVVWKPWQQEIIDLLEAEPDKRSINWYWEKSGNVGKTYLCKYLAATKNVIICDGKKDNIFNQVLTCIEAGKVPHIVLLDVPRTSVDFINYGALECLKNGLLYSGKYEGGQCVFKHPHVICFANELPNMEAMSADRWVITELTS